MKLFPNKKHLPFNQTNMSLKHFIILLVLALTVPVVAQIPVLNSNAGITNKVIYLDFDGQKVIGTAWNSGNLINALPSTMNSSNIIQIWKRVSEDYRPFNVNVTTDSMRFNNAVPNSRIRVVVTPTSAWYGSAGGVAYVGSFAWGGTPGTPCWIFENQLGYSAKNIAEAASHEAGHSFTLRHQSTYNTACAKTNEYNPGLGTGVTSWAPIMGVGYSKNVTIWHNGTSATSCNTIQFDHGNSGIGITSPGYLSFLPDDVGDVYNTAKILNLTTLTTLDSGIITQPTDVDAFKFTICNNRTISIAVKPWALDTTSYSGANLDVRFSLYNASNVLLATDTNLTKLNTLIAMNLTAGSYYFTIDGGRSLYYTDYGSLGRYYISIKATNPPALANTILTNSNICSGQTANLNYSSNGIPTSWQWTVSGTSSSTFASQNPTYVFNTAGVYTISLLATSATSLSCPTTVTLNVGTLPVISINAPPAGICPNSTGTLSASGASSYYWLPGGYNGSTQIVSPLSNTTYTVIGSNGTCSNSAVKTLSVITAINISALVSNSLLCYGESATLTASGANTYTFEPGTITSNPAIITPFSSTTYTITGSLGSCQSTGIQNITVNPAFSASLIVSSESLCIGQSIYFAGDNANSYTINPGNITSNPAVVAPTVSTNYSIHYSNNYCAQDTSILISVDLCNYTGLSQLNLQNTLNIFPNPARNEVIIDLHGGSGSLIIYSSLGEIVVSEVLENKTQLILRVQDWPRGIYFVRLQNESQSGFTQKLIIN